jgi:hypothetical protein
MDVKLMRFRQKARVIVSDHRERARSYNSAYTRKEYER